MALITLCSIKGAPGVTAAAVAMTMTWPRPALLVEADSSGSSAIMAGLFRGQVSQERSLLSLTIAAAHSSVEDVLWSQCIQLPGAEGKTLLSAPPNYAQAQFTKRVWIELAEVLAGLDRGGVDVIIDAGRFATTNAPLPLIERSDAVMVLTGAGLPALHAARGSVAHLQQHLDTHATGADALALILREGDYEAYARAEIVNLLRAPVLATLPQATNDAAVYSHGRRPDRRHDHSDYLRSIRRAGANARELIESRRVRLTRPEGQYPTDREDSSRV